MSKKTPRKKSRLAKKTRQNRRVPVFATIRSEGAAQTNPKRRNWRTDKIKQRDKE
ncbi:50S ribosomal protein L39e [Candidatus Micrarchaeota archaeon]|nr:50S ribosomal protein L39e [Candidatus Micrarchaeota archaeon]